MQLKDRFLSKQIPIQYRFFNFVTLLYILVGLVGFGVCSYFGVPMEYRIATLIFAVLCIGVGVAANVSKKYDVWAPILYILVNVVLMPVAYFTMGGVRVGADVWIVASVLLGVLILSPKAMHVLLCVNLVVYGVTFAVAYKYPGLVNPVEDENAALVIVAVSVAIASIGVSTMLLYQRKEYAMQLSLNEVKEKELERLVNELQESKEHARRVNLARTGFLNEMSNGIHAPLGKIMDISEKLSQIEDDEVKTLASQLYAASNNTSSVIRNILDLSMMETKEFKLQKENYSLREVIRETYAMAKSEADRKDLRLILEVNESLPNMLVGDKERLRQILLNLLSNAVQYTSIGEIRYQFDAASITDKEVQLKISVKDTGIGIKEDKIATIFYRFNREEEVVHNGFEGIGLGLTVSNQLLTLMGSQLEVVSEYGQGSEFSFVVGQKFSGWEPVGTVEGILMDEIESLTNNEKNILKEYDPEEKSTATDVYEELIAVDVQKIKEDLEGEEKSE